jgi:hypothetical protein
MKLLIKKGTILFLFKINYKFTYRVLYQGLYILFPAFRNRRGNPVRGFRDKQKRDGRVGGLGA